MISMSMSFGVLYLKTTSLFYLVGFCCGGVVIVYLGGYYGLLRYL